MYVQSRMYEMIDERRYCMIWILIQNIGYIWCLSVLKHVRKPVTHIYYFLLMVSGEKSLLVQATYSGTLSSNSLVFFRPDGSSNYYFYQAFRVTISTLGTYVFTSSSSMDTYGYLYKYPVDPSYPNSNLIASDDDGNGNRQFKLNVSLSSSRTYVLLVTTYRELVTGQFTITVLGPASASLYSFTPSTSRPIQTSK